MKYGAFFALLLIVSTASGRVGDPDTVVTGRVIGIGFLGDHQEAAVVIESVQKGSPVRPLKVLIDAAAQKAGCCVSGERHKFYLKHMSGGLYSVVRLD